MKKFLALFCLPFVLMGCSSDEFVHSGEPRSSVYVGQSAGDLYENFGRPTKVIKKSNSEKIIIYQWQEMEKEWAYRYLRSCEMQFLVRDNRVVTWTADGEMCMIESHSAGHDSFNSPMARDYHQSEEGGLFDNWFSDDDGLADEYGAFSNEPLNTADPFSGVSEEFPSYAPAQTAMPVSYGTAQTVTPYNTTTQGTGGYNIPADAFM